MCGDCSVGSLITTLRLGALTGGGEEEMEEIDTTVFHLFIEIYNNDGCRLIQQKMKIVEKTNSVFQN